MKLHLALCLLLFSGPLAFWSSRAASAEPAVVPTFQCIGLYWRAPGGSTEKVCSTSYRAAGADGWKEAMPLWFDSRNHEYRGSIVGLRPGTSYEVRLQLQGTGLSASVQTRTWNEEFPVAKTIGCPSLSDKTLTITETGSAKGYILYEPASPTGAGIDVAGQSDYCVVVRASYVILRGLTLKGARIHAILVENGAHDVVIEGCDISGWGRIADDGWGKDYDAAIYSKDPSVKRIIVQRNRIHQPRSNSNNWQQARPRPGKTEPTHPEGPQAVCLWDSDGNHVIRYNTVFSDADHQYNDIFGAGHNFSTRGFPNCDSDIYGNLLSHCWDDAIESEGANCNVRVWGNYITEAFVGVAAASTSIGPLYVWRNVTGVIRESPTKSSGAFFKTSNRMGGGKIYIFHNTILQPPSPSDPNKTLGAVVGLGWGGPMTNVMSRNNLLHVTRQAIADRAHDPLGDYDYDLFAAPLAVAPDQEKHGIHGVPVYVDGLGLRGARGVFALAPQSPGLDAGVRLPDFNDDFRGSAPDIGAQEAGSPPMEFGADAYREKTTRTSDSGLAQPNEAQTETAPYPSSPIIQSLKWDDAVFKLKARAGDNWPITWVGGDLQITAWGDGPGFDEQPPRLSLGFARVWGAPPNLRAEDFAADADTLEGGGSSAVKASGLLLVDGTLYMWVRNYRPPGSDDFTNARLAWSKNLGTNWTWAEWHFADTFGCPEFVQFGPNYAGARDDYVYVVSQANDSAYGFSPDIVMARVPRNQVPERDRYEFFAGLDQDGRPRWSQDLKQRRPIFRDAQGTQRIAITYNPGLGRYLLTTSHRPTGSHATHTSALGVFDAPEPWGPWTTVYYNSQWSGTNRTYHHKFPTKWMSPDGRTLWLLYSGLDGGLYTFCLKKATLETRQRTFYCDPIKGSVQGDGSAEHPWPTIQEVIRAGLIQLCNQQGQPSNPHAPVKPGDTVLLRSGWQGILSLSGGYNRRPITIAAAPGQTPQVGWVEIGEGRNWIVRGLTVSPSLAPTPLVKVPRQLVSLGERGGEESADLVVEDCFVYSVLDTTGWTARDWVEKPASGIWLGRHGRHHVARNNYVLNTRFGIQLCAPDCLAEGNVVANFSADGMRATRDGQVLQYNVIKNNFVGARDGDANHDDGIQVFLFNVGTGTVRDVTLRGNIIIARETDGLPFPNPLQGIGCFDGPLVHFLVESNVVCVNHYHGISLYDAQDCTIRGNTCFSRWPDRARPWIMLGQKKNQAGGNIVRDNLAHSYNFKADAQVKAEDNGEVTPAAFDRELTEVLTLIDARFGALHPTAKRPRLEPDRMGPK